jgi:myo-inositol-1(or 4)-monophosphatase
MHPMLNVAVKAVRRAGQIINRAALDIETVKVGAKGPGDFVTEIDHAVEADIIQTLQMSFPQHAVLAEESGRFGDANATHEWVIDPIDGTTNFIHGLPHYAVAIALRVEGVVTQACVFAPATNDLFTASKGEGAFLNNRRIRVSKRIRFNEALLGASFARNSFSSHSSLQRAMGELSVQTAGVRRLGSTVLDLAFVAAGRLDGCFSIGPKPWDIATGQLLVTEAGGLFSDIAGEANYFENGTAVAGTPKIFAPLLAQLAPVAAARAAAQAEQGLPVAAELTPPAPTPSTGKRLTRRKADAA